MLPGRGVTHLGRIDGLAERHDRAVREQAAEALDPWGDLPGRDRDEERHEPGPIRAWMSGPA